MRLSRWLVPGLMLGLAAGCDTAPDAEGPGPEKIAPRPGDPQPVTGTLAIDRTADETSGTYALDGRQLTFRARSLEGDRVDLSLDFGDLVLSAVGDNLQKRFQLDGFAAANGLDTQITDADRQLVGAFHRSLEEDLVGRKDQGLSSRDELLERFTSLWSEWSDGLELARPVLADKDRVSATLCGRAWQWVRGTHDCWSYERWEDRSSAWGSVATRGQAFPDGQYTHQYSTDRRSWGGAMDHKRGNFMAGSCMGRCGAGCGDLGANLTQDCMDHDICVTGNHGSSSFWCSDEFADTVDDFAGGVPCVLPNGGADPAWLQAWQRNGFPYQAPY